MKLAPGISVEATVTVDRESDGRLYALNMPGSSVHDYTVDEHGLLLDWEAPTLPDDTRWRQVYTYDPMNRPTGVTTLEGPDVDSTVNTDVQSRSTLVWNAQGQLTEMLHEDPHDSTRDHAQALCYDATPGSPTRGAVTDVVFGLSTCPVDPGDEPGLSYDHAGSQYRSVEERRLGGASALQGVQTQFTHDEWLEVRSWKICGLSGSPCGPEVELGYDGDFLAELVGEVSFMRDEDSGRIQYVDVGPVATELQYDDLGTVDREVL